MGFLNQSVLQKTTTISSVEKHPLLMKCDMPLNVKQAYLQGCVLAALERDDGKLSSLLRQEIVRLGLSLALSKEEIDDTIAAVSGLTSSEAQEELLGELFSILSQGVYPRYFMRDFERLLTIGGRNLANASQTLDFFGSSLLGKTDDWHAKIREDELAEKRALISAKVYKHGDTKTITLPGGETMELVYCAPGEFTMGCSRIELKRILGESFEESYYDEEPHKVKLTKGFWMGRYPVTIGQWRSVVESSVIGIARICSLVSSDRDYKDWQITKDRIKSHTDDYNNRIAFSDSHPVFDVTWTQCVNFAKKVGTSLGLKVRLPTEAEWEYACRAGNGQSLIQGIEKYVNVGYQRVCDVNAGFIESILGGGYNLEDCIDYPRAVGLGCQNPWGFYDMLGNVQEWCCDVYDRFVDKAVIDPNGPSSGSVHVCRGTSRGDDLRQCRPSRRAKKTDDYFDFVGVRLVFDTVDAIESPKLDVESKTVGFNDIIPSSSDVWKQVLGVKEELVRRYGAGTVKLYGYVAGAMGVFLFTGCCIRWWLATILAGIATARFGAVVNHGGFECLLPAASIVVAIILFFMGV